ncbi:eukaryotic translation initiation factor 2B, epsilon subunit, putative [Entamoeba invadens IP1]|uniref:eukaryotic translation initiation factor 2B, epsilon subunit, putative n=1 Tax=Entamoeba invadens IP1 TaxID=370355 RepID=UPI0002C3EA0B|nr:eukaryotic translation initiation factor 2B, epsilon subunit, putative [Entamoeba invadens IP1]ELP85107.1 eukaryotic translation initiation factor 2B, epsilon subunit, putative [Entamoeba invadens IP1]|eukprot:XP_004184453.1 eukaryotic translation initiation factor 2B, epsilon subunit, putative [Entamoeba invadens IP1]
MDKKKKQDQNQQEVPQKRQAVILVENEIVDMQCNASMLMILNTPLIQYIVEHLLAQNIQEIFIACSEQNKQKIQLILDTPLKSKNVQYIVCAETNNAGEIIRQISESPLLDSNELILIKGDVITTMQLEPILKFHREILQSDKSHIVTMVYRKNHTVNESRSTNDKTVIITNALTNQILKVDDRHDKTKRNYRLKMCYNKETPKIGVHTDYMETGVFIVTRQGLSLFNDAENCDIKEFPEAFYARILDLDALIHFHMHCYVTNEKEYSVRIRDITTFRKVSSELLQRHAYPYTTNLGVYSFDIKMYDHNVIAHVKSTIPLSVIQNSKNVLFCEESVINEKVVANDAVICSNCVIGEGSLIENSQIFKNVQIGKNVKIISSVVGNNCVIEDGAVVKGKFLCEYTKVSRDQTEVNTKTVENTRMNHIYGEDLFRSGSALITLNDAESDDEEPNIMKPSLQTFDSFRNEVTKLVIAFQENQKHGTLQSQFHTELTSIKASYNYTIGQTFAALIEALLLIGDKECNKDIEDHLESLEMLWEMNSNFTLEPNDQVETLFFLCEFCDDNTYFEDSFVYIMNALYEHNFIWIDSIWKWKEVCVSTPEEHQKYLDLSEAFLTALKNAEDRGDVEEDDEEEEEEEEGEEENEEAEEEN